jgi:hypothetical protein
VSERDELLDWMTAWQAEAPITDQLRETVRRRVARSQRVFFAELIVEAITGVVGLAITLAIAFSAATAVERIAMWALSAVIVIACVVSWRGRRGLWQPAASSTRAWLDFLLRRAQLVVRMTSAAAVLLVVEVAIFIPWVWARSTTMWRGIFGFTLLALMTAGFTLWLVRRRRAATRDIAQLSQLQRELRSE